MSLEFLEICFVSCAIHLISLIVEAFECFIGGASGKEPICQCRKHKTSGFDPLEKEMVTHFSILPWEITWTEKFGGLQCVESQRGENFLSNLAHTYRSFRNVSRNQEFSDLKLRSTNSNAEYSKRFSFDRKIFFFIFRIFVCSLKKQKQKRIGLLWKINMPSSQMINQRSLSAGIGLNFKKIGINIRQ